MNRVSSERINLLRFPLIVGVVFIHNSATVIDFSNASIELVHLGSFYQFCRDIITGISRIAVPLFYMMSGYLFFQGVEWSLAVYKTKIRKRIHSLLIPFLFWNVITILFLSVAQSIPLTQVYFSGMHKPISSYNTYDYANAIFGLNRTPVSYQFWFIRDLMVLVLLSPFLHALLKKIPLIFLGLFALLWYLEVEPIYIPSLLAIFFFSIGSFLAISEKDLFYFDRYGNTILFMYIIVFFYSLVFMNYEDHAYSYKTSIILGVATALYITKYVHACNKIRSHLIKMSYSSFFVFAVHEPLLTIVKKISFKLLLPESDMILLCLYLVIPIVVISFSLLFYKLLKAVVPKTLSIITGGR